MNKIMWFALLVLLLAVAAASCLKRNALHPRLRANASVTHEVPMAFCNGLVRLGYDPRSDGTPAYYDNRTGELLVDCAGLLTNLPPEQRPVCPPPEWTCDK
ncbi:hypothetical protein [Pseudoxanthomonas mexicana]|uniref:hypothetical protein n=1 Tax=Pseudoxanthomonas mexicana TaxID=128785 RepID=UPI00398A9376